MSRKNLSRYFCLNRDITREDRRWKLEGFQRETRGTRTRLCDSPRSEILLTGDEHVADLPSRFLRKIRFVCRLVRKVRVNSWEHLHSSFIQVLYPLSQPPCGKSMPSPWPAVIVPSTGATRCTRSQRSYVAYKIYISYINGSHGYNITLR